MYSAVLMLALVAGNDSIEHGRNRCGGCTGYGGGCSGYVGGCSGIVGGHGHHGAVGCSSSYVGHGCSSYGCSSSCSGRRGLFGGGLFGGHHNRGCNGSACHGSSYGGCTSGVYQGGVYQGGCTGGVYQGGVYGTPVVPGTKKDMPKGEPVPDPKTKPKNPVVAPATIVVNVPADARLFVDGAATTSTSEVRTLVTPTIEVGTTYVYTMRAEVVRDGRTVEQTQVVNVTGGQTANVRFNFSQSVASR
jgi:uncharacterized protein (TIGR03000 family)